MRPASSSGWAPACTACSASTAPAETTEAKEGAAASRPSTARTRHEFSVEARDSGGAKNNELVLARAARGPRHRQSARPRDRAPRRHERAARRLADRHPCPRHPHGFSERGDRRSRGPPKRSTSAAAPICAHLALVTIDPEDARDHDDAVWAGPDDNPNNKGGHVAIVAIADVAHYVTPGSALDREAYRRGNSAYFPDRVVPMLPERPVRRSLLADGRRGPAVPRRAHDLRQARRQEAPRVHPRHHALARLAHLPAGPARLRRQAGQRAGRDRAHRADAAVACLSGAVRSAQKTRAARSRPCRAAHRHRRRRQGEEHRLSRAPGIHEAHRGVHDPGQRRRRREPGGRRARR